MVLFVILLRCFICVEAIQTGNADLIKFVSFISIYYVINLDIVSSYMDFSYLYYVSIDILQV